MCVVPQLTAPSYVLPLIWIFSSFAANIYKREERSLSSHLIRKLLQGIIAKSLLGFKQVPTSTISFNMFLCIKASNTEVAPAGPEFLEDRENISD